ncbi:MAG TPA: hypothetical protein VLI39_07555 [Sedimentisphaerales bacterium]|nr:hypothetical protein [Sedimentisphaerales bacterium]
MTDKELAVLAQKLSEEVAEKLREFHVCRLNLSESEVSQAPHLFGVLTDLGEGDIRKGIEAFRENNRCVKKMRERGEKTALAAWLCWITLLVGGAASALWLGFKSLLHLQQKIG